MDRIKVGILGSTGLVGQQFVRMLDRHPYFEVAALSSSPRSRGRRYGDAVDWMVSRSIPEESREIVLAELEPESLKAFGIKVVFSALPASVAADTERRLAAEGFPIFTNASAFRMSPDVPILIPEVNAEHLDLVAARGSARGGFIVANSNCSTAGLVIGLRPLLGFGMKSVTVTTYQALSGAGRRGVVSLDILGNVIPFIRDEEEKIERETRKILGRLSGGRIEDASLEVNASCARVPSRDGHLESVVIETEEDLGPEAVREALASFSGVAQEMGLPTAPERPIVVLDKPDRPQPLFDVEAGSPERARGMAVSVGRIRKKGGKISFFLLVHNTIRGAAGTCILSAEYALRKNLVS